MKKIFTLVFALGAVTAVFAQRGYDHSNESRDVILGQPNHGVYNNNGYYDKRYRDEQIQRIRREYDWKIQSVQHDRFLRRSEKKRQIRFLEAELNAKIREVMRYDSRGSRVYGRRY